MIYGWLQTGVNCNEAGCKESQLEVGFLTCVSNEPDQ